MCEADRCLWHILALFAGTTTLQMSGGELLFVSMHQMLDVYHYKNTLHMSTIILYYILKLIVCFLYVSLEDGCLPYSKPSFPSPGGHSSSGTASSKGSTGPRKAEGPRQPQQWTATEHADFLGTNGQGQYTGELCE